jgi:hypothetical protein
VQARIEIERYARAETGAINRCFRQALTNVLKELVRGEDDWPFEAEEDAEIVAAQWFTNEDTKQEILKLLGKLNLDESVIVAEAIELAEPKIEPLRDLIYSAESRFHKALRALEDYRAGPLGRLRRSAAPTIDGEVIENAPPRRLSGRR